MSSRHPGSPGRAASAIGRVAALIRNERVLSPLLALGIGVLLILVFQHLSQSVDYRSVIRELRHMSAGEWGASLAATALSYVALVARDAVGLRYVAAKVPRAALWIGAIAGSALGNATGFGALTGGAVRARVYGVSGVTPAQIGRMTVFTSATLALALVLMTAIGMVCVPGTLGAMLHVAPGAMTAIGIVLLVVLAAMTMMCGAAARPVVTRFKWLAFDVPARRDFVAQIVSAVFDVIAAGLTLWVLLPAAPVGFPTFITVYAAALLLGMIGHTPGGIGVFEAAMVFTLGSAVPAHAMLAALIAYRAIYFGVPLVLSAGLLAAFEGRALRRRLVSRQAARVSQLAPLFLSLVTFAVGSMLVISSATPAFWHRIAILRNVIPLWVLEGSQVICSVLGVALLFVARGLLRRLDGAWWMTFVLTLASLALSLAKGLAFVEAGVLGTLLVLLLVSRRRFNRHSSLLAERFTLSWFVSVTMVLILAVWVL